MTQQASYSNLRQHQDLSPHQLIYDFRLTIMRNNFWIDMKDKKDVIYLKALFFFTVSVEFSAPCNLLRKSS